MITRALDYLIHGADAGQFVNLGNPHTVEKIAIAQARQTADLWCRVERSARREWGIERKAREQAVAVKRPAARVIQWRDAR